MTLSHFPIIELDIVDSTNNYAMQLIDADKAQPGLTIVAQSQTGGKGQRGKTWEDTPGQSILMTVLTAPGRPITDQFLFNSSVAVAIANVLQKLDNNWDVRIKWPNDIIINDKKAGGILIENILRGSRWTYSVIGLGLNVKQQIFPSSLPYATSLRIASGYDFDVVMIRDKIRENIINLTANPLATLDMTGYNDYLYKRGKKQHFLNAGDRMEAKIIRANPDGTLEVQLQDGSIVCYHHGQILWDWQ